MRGMLTAALSLILVVAAAVPAGAEEAREWVAPFDVGGECHTYSTHTPGSGGGGVACGPDYGAMFGRLSIGHVGVVSGGLAAEVWKGWSYGAVPLTVAESGVFELAADFGDVMVVGGAAASLCVEVRSHRTSEIVGV